ncbi:MAG: 6-carboxytetrahydropterin synthase [Candidatus Amulumruptor caecigallinarius]|nr:6-carboxytetrahydropterin synthase [Candidatus Amulumruptor caecigallinarius]MCM1397825.1 6-carboxytetrahydropterin synthase [Candidatus Amulumruptor caecigallinarius]MCM1454882.1 6-carboxytetrahydropterin synthase [bacterium]
MYYVSKRIEVAGAHRLDLPYESKCSRLHGHNWVITIHCRARELNAQGMVADFSAIKEQIHGYLDHGNFNELLPFNPTAENIARWVCERVPHCYRVEVRESEGNLAAYEVDE